MKDIEEVYVDGVETIHLLNTTVRLDLFTLQPPREEGGQPAPHVFERIVMPVQSFLNMHAAMQQIIDKMAGEGLIKPGAQAKNNWDMRK